MQIIYDIFWLLKIIFLSITIIIVLHFLLEYLKENYDFDFFENYFNKPKIFNEYSNEKNSNLLHLGKSNLTNNIINNSLNNLNNNEINMDEELKNLINKKINNKIDNLENVTNIENNSFTSINELPIIN